MINVMLVDNEPEDGRMLQALAEIAQLKLDFVHCTGVDRALETLAEGQADAGLMDIGADSIGLDGLRRVHTAAPDMPLVVLTALNDEVQATESLKCGAQDYLVKGNITADSLWRALRHAMERQRVQLQIVNLSLTDDLTGLYNRRGFLALAGCR